MTYRVNDLRKIMKDNGIKDGYMMVKREIIDLLREKQFRPQKNQIVYININI